MSRAARRSRFVGVLLTALTVLACSKPGPDVIHYDGDACDHCRMTISDPAFAAQLVTQTGKVYRFDDPACLARFVATARVTSAEVHAIWVNDHAQPDRSIKVEDAVFVVSSQIRAPMNGGMAAYASLKEARALGVQLGGRVENWAEVLKRAAS